MNTDNVKTSHLAAHEAVLARIDTLTRQELMARLEWEPDRTPSEISHTKLDLTNDLSDVPLLTGGASLKRRKVRIFLSGVGAGLIGAGVIAKRLTRK